MGRRRALISVWDKSGVVDFARGLAEIGWELLSTGGTARALRDGGVDATDISIVTGHPEMMEGRVKTLHPAVHASLLARRHHRGDMEALAGQGYRPIDLVAVNLYPFRETVAAPDVTMATAMEHLDIGGPTLIRAAAKNHRHVWAVVDPEDYGRVLEALWNERTSADTEGVLLHGDLRRELASKVFREISRYDAGVSRYLAAAPDGLADEVALFLDRHGGELRYGENPGQHGGLYRLDERTEGISALDQLHGKQLSYNNILDLDGALSSLAPFASTPDPAVCIVKHTTPCGLAVRGSLAAAFERARLTDPVSAFGGVVAANRPIDEECASAIASIFLECIVAPGYASGAMELLTARQGLRLLAFPGGGVDRQGGLDFLARAAGGGDGGLGLRSVYGGFLAQSLPEPPRHPGGDAQWRVVTRRKPSPTEAHDLSFAWAAVAGVKSNAILIARGLATVGIGTGQTSRVDSSKLAVRKAAAAGLAVKGSVLASDAFFPFRDGVDAAAEAGVAAIVQPGGSIRDQEVVAAADEHGIAMVMTGRRLFRH
ncbi:MAG: bifunctional phosphoribosylaminoimidazolecarboxamide formyltransferase/IMP cyclohydrolase [Gemmatimonadetes bacterium]|nr:bifunctional phosphoribosylaminoimidazolecarboxamide formyltransferase/IMP cyclohydrolase [Gemmatimonadota bacterium]